MGLPSGAVPMFTAPPVEPIGIGVDGKHYAYPSGRTLGKKDKHMDSSGRVLSGDVVNAADAIVPALKLATIVRSSILTKEKCPIYDAFGRILRRQRDGSLLSLDGQKLPGSAKLFDAVGNPTTMPPSGNGEKKTLLVETYSKEGVKQCIAKIGIEDQYTTLQDLHQALKKKMDAATSTKVTSIVFLYKGTPITDADRVNWVCSKFLPALVVVCRDMQGHLMALDGDMIELEVDHAATDQETARDAETEFVKMVSMLKRKRASIAMGHATNVTPRSSGPASVRNW